MAEKPRKWYACFGEGGRPIAFFAAPGVGERFEDVSFGSADDVAEAVLRARGAFVLSGTEAEKAVKAAALGLPEGWKAAVAEAMARRARRRS